MPAKKDTATKRKVSKGDVYECGVCGMSAIVDEPCGIITSISPTTP